MAHVLSVQSTRRRRKRRRLFRHPPSRLWRWLPLISVIAVAGWLQGATAPDGNGFRHYVGYGYPRSIEKTYRFPKCVVATQHNCVFDGDSVKVSGRNIRLEDIEAPETDDARCDAERELGERATKRMIELMSHGHFRVVDTGGRDEDRYGRKLRVIVRAGRSLGDTLIREGLARPNTGFQHNWCS